MRWEFEGLFQVLTPLWAVDPDILEIERIFRTEMQLEDALPCSVAYFAKGTFHMVYQVISIRGIHVVRVALPLASPQKMREAKWLLWTG
jgi:hypothetical protein